MCNTKVEEFKTIVPYNDEVDVILGEKGNLFEYKQIRDVTLA